LGVNNGEEGRGGKSKRWEKDHGSHRGAGAVGEGSRPTKNRERATKVPPQRQSTRRKGKRERKGHQIKKKIGVKHTKGANRKKLVRVTKQAVSLSRKTEEILERLG